MIDEHIGLPALLLDLVGLFMQKHNIRCEAAQQKIIQFKQQPRVPIQVWWQILEDLYLCHPKPVLGHYIGDLMQPHHVSILGYLALSSPDVKQFLTNFYKFQPILQNFSKFTFELTEAHILLKWTPVLGKNTQLSNEVLVSGLLSILKKILACDDLKPLALAFAADAPSYKDYVPQIYGCPVSFSSPALHLYLPIELLDRKIPTHDEHLQLILAQQARALINAIADPDPFLKQLQDLILKYLQTGEPTAQLIAAQMDLSLRSFYRKLKQHQLQFSDLVKKTRLELAKTYLAESQLSLVEIAFLLGYAEHSAFSRAFKQWLNMSPSEYRKQFKNDLI